MHIILNDDSAKEWDFRILRVSGGDGQNILPFEPKAHPTVHHNSPRYQENLFSCRSAAFVLVDKFVLSLNFLRRAPLSHSVSKTSSGGKYLSILKMVRGVWTTYL